jgi:hypothetical protein
MEVRILPLEPGRRRAPHPRTPSELGWSSPRPVSGRFRFDSGRGLHALVVQRPGSPAFNRRMRFRVPPRAQRAVSWSSDSVRLKTGRTWCEPTTAHGVPSGTRNMVALLVWDEGRLCPDRDGFDSRTSPHGSRCLVMRLASQLRCRRSETGSIPVRGASKHGSQSHSDQPSLQSSERRCDSFATCGIVAQRESPWPAPRRCEFESRRFHQRSLRASSKGRTPVFQAADAGSNPAVRSASSFREPIL